MGTNDEKAQSVRARGAGARTKRIKVQAALLRFKYTIGSSQEGDGCLPSSNALNLHTAIPRFVPRQKPENKVLD